MSTSNDLPSLYENKENIQEHPEIPDINKITASDMNLIREFLQNALYKNGDRISDVNNQLLDLVMPRYENEIVETENAIAIKFEDGIMICSGKKNFTNVKMGAWGNIQSGGPIIFDDYPVPFTKVYSVTVTPIPGMSNFWVFTDDNNPPTLTRPGGWQIARGTANTVNGGLNYITIGRWKEVQISE